MARTAVEIDPQLIAFMLPSIPESVPIARFHIRAALSFHQLDEYADDAAIITSELVTNAIAHARAQAINLELIRLEGLGAVAVIVTDPSPRPPVKLDPTENAQHGRGLHIVEALSTRWGWSPRGPGKAVFAIITRER